MTSTHDDDQHARGTVPPGPAAPTDPPRSARRVAATWRRLAAPTAERTGLPDLDALPDPVRRWLSRAVAPGAPTSSGVVLEMSGRIRVGVWRAFTARQVIAADRGYVWAADARFGRLPVLGYDRYEVGGAHDDGRDDGGADGGGSAEMRWRLAGLLPVVTERGDDVRRSAAGRLAGELVLNPGAALAPHVRWEAVDDARARARVRLGGDEHVVTVDVDEAGVVRSARLPRWGDPAGSGAAMHEFVARCSGDRSFGDYRLPAHVEAGWDLDGPGATEPFIVFDVDAATFV